MTTQRSGTTGGRNRRNGRDTEAYILQLIRAHFPGAERTRAGDTGDDYTGAGDRVLEATRANWDQTGHKIDQAARVAQATDLSEFWVLKHTPGRGARGPRVYAITVAEVILPMLRELDELRALRQSGRGDYERGYNAGYAAARQAPAGQE